MPADRQQPTTIIVNQQPSQALPALVNVFLPGVGQLIQGRFLACIAWWLAFAVSIALMMAVIGFVTTPILWLACIVDAARYRR